VEDVDDDVPEIEKHPAPLLPTLAPKRLDASLDHPLFDLARNRQHVALVTTGDENKRVGEGQRTGNIEGNDVLTLLRVCGNSREVYELESTVRCSHWFLEFEIGASALDLVGHEGENEKTDHRDAENGCRHDDRGQQSVAVVRLRGHHAARGSVGTHGSDGTHGSGVGRDDLSVERIVVDIRAVDAMRMCAGSTSPVDVMELRVPPGWGTEGRTRALVVMAEIPVPTVRLSGLS
jgi:hypothetical protein